MQKTIANRLKFNSFLYFLTLSILAVYLFLAFLPLPGGIARGLDPSWTYGISRAAVDKLIFGKDIIFTYGPFGYLVQGAALEQNFFAIAAFQIGIHLALLGVTLVKLVELKNSWHRVSLSISLLLTYLIGLGTEYRIVFVFLILLSWDNILHKKSIRWWALGLGAVTGFCFLTKFTVGICTFGSLFLLLLCNLYKSLKSSAEVRISVLALVDAMLASASASFLFLNPNPLLNLHKLLICMAVSGVVRGMAWLLQQQLQNPSLIPKSRETPFIKTLPNLTENFAGWQGFYWTYCLSLLITILYSSPSLLDFIKGSLELSSGYSSAMSIVASPWEVGCAILEVAIVLALLLITNLRREILPGFALSLAFILWMTFKHGFVRQDGHVTIFIFSVPLIVALCVSKLQTSRIARFAFIVNAYVIAMALVYYFVPLPFGQQLYRGNLFQDVLNPTVVANKVSALLNLNQFQRNTNAANITNLSTVKLPQNVQDVLKDKTVDIIPWEVSLVPANNLNWKPRPVFQSYAAYTTFLDNANLKSLLGEPRDYIMYQFSSIDSRHPFVDEPQTLFHVFCNYAPSANFPDFVSTPAIPKLIILENRHSNRCSSGIEGKELSVSWNQLTEVSDKVLVRAAIKFEYSILGKIYKTLFRSPPVMMNITFLDGSSYSYRIVPENSENSIIVSPLPVTDEEALAFLKGDFIRAGSLFSFFTSNPLIFKSKIKLKLTYYNVLGSSFKQQILAENLKAAIFNPKQSDDYIGWIDSKQTSTRRGKMIQASGWAVAKLSPKKETLVLLTYGASNRIISVAKTGLPRPDVAQFFKNNDYYSSGWVASFSSNLIDGKVQTVKAWIYDPSDNTAKPINGEYGVEIP